MINIEDITGKTVISATGSYIGEIYDVDIDPNTWHTVHLKVKLSGAVVKQLGLKKRLHRHSMLIPTKLIKQINVIVQLNQSLPELTKNIEISID